ncbi:MAG TPA: hypothetical protein VHB19_02150 [Devosia sp.]|jgi:hypothetical protein|nr:hypothetical protein [Devosia sp.]
MPLINIRNSGDIAIWLVALLALLAFLDSIFNYFWTGNGIHGTEGALLVVASTFLMGVAAVLIGNRWVGGWLRTLFEILLVLDFAGTAAAAYLLEAWILLILVVLAFVAWIAHVVRPARRTTPNLG